jgi:subtilase family serine protease
VIRRLLAFTVTIAAIVSVSNVVCQAQPQSVKTRVILEEQTKLVGHLPSAQTMRIVLVLPLRHQTELQNFIEQVNDRNSPLFRQFVTVDEFTERFGPSQEDYDTLIAFAKSHNLTVVDTSRNRVNLQVAGRVSDIEKALNVTMGLYQHPTENRTYYAPDREPSLELPFQLWHVAGIDNYYRPYPKYQKRSETPGVHSLATTGSCPSASFCGSDIRAAYYGGTLTGTGQIVGLLEYYGTDLADLTTYYKNAKQTEPLTPTLISTDGSSTSCLESAGCDDTEQTLDMTQALGMAPGMKALNMFIGATDSAMLNSMATHTPLASNLSCSWGWRDDPSTDDPYFMEFAAQGQNFFAAAGDSGKWPSSGAEAAWPANSVYVVSVGGTDLTTASAGGAWKSETAWVDGGGGISPQKTAVFDIPSWQTSYINFSTCTKCSKTYRNGPDVSANANFTYYVCADQTTCTANSYGGTSFAAPAWAGYMALINQQYETTSGKSTGLGFLNPLIYPLAAGSGYATDFHDITSGSNGDKATKGYDPATGWGSMNGSGLINALK